MSPTIAACRPAAVDYERTLILSIEVSNQNWVLAAQVPGLPHTKAKRTVDPEAEALMAAIAGYRSRAAAMGRQYRTRDCRLRGGMVRLLARAMAYEA